MITATRPSSPDRPNEDAVRHGGTWAVVVDGAGVPQQYRAGCHHEVAWYAHALADALAAALSVAPAAGLRAVLAEAISHVAALHSDECRLDQGSPSATVAMFRVGDDHVDLLVLADAAVVLEETDAVVSVLTDTALPRLLAHHRDAAIAEPWGPWIEARRNVVGGFWCAQHLPEAADHAVVETVASSQMHQILAVSDGVSRLWEFLGWTPAQALHRAAADAEGLLDDLRAAEVAQAERPRAAGLRKPHDDATLALHRLI